MGRAVEVGRCDNDPTPARSAMCTSTARPERVKTTLVVTLSGYIAIYIARTSTESYVEFQYEPKLALYALYPRRMYVGTSMRVIRLIE